MLFRVILTLIFSCWSGFFASSFAAQTLDDLNAHLKAKKAELDPFDESKVKVDIESLGLDDVDKKDENKFTEKELPKPEKKAEVKEGVEEKAEAKEEAGIISNLVKKVNSLEKEVEAKIAPEKKVKPVAVKTPKKVVANPKKKHINARKQKILKRQLALEKKRKENAKRQKEKLEKFYKLRKLYLFEAEKRADREKIIPRKKDLSPFIDEELPALPILSHYRSAENVHIPLILTPKEKVDLLFSTISKKSVSSFNDAYLEVENPNVQNSFGDTLLTYAMLMRRYGISASIIAKGADLSKPNKLGYTPLNIAIELLDFKLVKMLIKNNVDLEYTDAFGRTYLMHAARVGFVPAVDMLISHGIDINAMDKDGFNALSIAYRHKQELVTQYLIKHGAKTWIEKSYNPKKQSLIQELENHWK